MVTDGDQEVGIAEGGDKFPDDVTASLAISLGTSDDNRSGSMLLFFYRNEIV